MNTFKKFDILRFLTKLIWFLANKNGGFISEIQFFIGEEF